MRSCRLYFISSIIYDDSELTPLQESMMTIFAIVNAEKEGHIESKMMKARQLEEIREAKKKEAESRHQQKKSKLV
jgi:hypothetical protein